MQRLLRLPLGLAVTGVVFGFFELVKNLAEQVAFSVELQLLLKFIQFAAGGFGVMYLCPVLFIRLGLAMVQASTEAEKEAERKTCPLGDCQ